MQVFLLLKIHYLMVIGNLLCYKFLVVRDVVFGFDKIRPQFQALGNDAFFSIDFRERCRNMPRQVGINPADLKDIIIIQDVYII